MDMPQQTMDAVHPTSRFRRFFRKSRSILDKVRPLSLAKPSHLKTIEVPTAVSRSGPYLGEGFYRLPPLDHPAGQLRLLELLPHDAAVDEPESSHPRPIEIPLAASEAGPNFGRGVYRHNALDHPASEVRLLEILPYDADVCEPDLAYNLKTWDLYSAPEYTAISYTWIVKAKCVAKPGSKIIRIDGDTYPVGDNCYMALLRAAPHGRYFWIDGVCINQNDLVEKSSQVAIMADVYTQASHVVAYVGEHADDSEMMIRIFRVVGEFFRTLHETDESSLKAQVHRKFDACMMSLREKTSCSTSLRQPYGRFAKAWRSFGGRRYWLRKWILQEIWLPRHVTILCAETSTEMGLIASLRNLMPWLAMAESINVEERSFITRHPTFWHRTNMWRLLDAVVRSRSNQSECLSLPGFADLVSKFQGLECSDFHDHLYALLKLTDWSGSTPVPDYNLNKKDFVVQFLWNLFTARTPTTNRSVFNAVQYLLLTTGFFLPFSGEARQLIDGRDSGDPVADTVATAQQHLRLQQSFDGWPRVIRAPFDEVSGSAPPVRVPPKGTSGFLATSRKMGITDAKQESLIACLNPSVLPGDFLIQLDVSMNVCLLGRANPETARVDLYGYGIVTPSDDSFGISGLPPGLEQIELYLSAEDLLVLALLQISQYDQGLEHETNAKILRMSPTTRQNPAYGILTRRAVNGAGSDTDASAF